MFFQLKDSSGARTDQASPGPRPWRQACAANVAEHIRGLRYTVIGGSLLSWRACSYFTDMAIDCDFCAWLWLRMLPRALCG